MEDQAECMLVLIGATPEGKKELVGFQVGVRESAQSWRELLVEIKRRGLSIPPRIAVGKTVEHEPLVRIGFEPVPILPEGLLPELADPTAKPLAHLAADFAEPCPAES